LLDPEPELLDPEPELLDPEPEFDPEWSSDPSSSDPPWSSDGEGEADAERDGLGESVAEGVRDPEDSDGVRLGCTTLPTSPARASAPTVRAIAAASPPMPSTTMPTTRFMTSTVAGRPLRPG
jgi:hypothetical protein